MQFCANNPSTLLQAARLVQDHCDAVDINLGCPQRIARKGKYGAFLMENMDLIESLVTTLAQVDTIRPTSFSLQFLVNATAWWYRNAWGRLHHT